jgi:hypothetical protein
MQQSSFSCSYPYQSIRLWTGRAEKKTTALQAVVEKIGRSGGIAKANPWREGLNLFHSLRFAA